MKILQNLHTHTKFCDGANTPLELVEKAIEKGFSSIGFSGHAYVPEADYTMTPEATVQYKKELYDLKEKYKDKIEIFCGLEFDMFSETDLSGYDYLIGALHFSSLDIKIDVDLSLEKTEGIINNYFSGDGIAYAKEYYRSLSKLPEYGNFDILAHFDLITKFSEKKILFDTDSKEYKNATIESLEALSGKIPFFEVNTGAISRGYRTTPYPAPFILKEMKRLGFGAVVTTDCHNKNMLDFGYDDAIDLLKENGFTERYILTKNGFQPIKI